MKKDKEKTLDCDTVLVSIGRRPYINGLGLDEVGVKLDDKGRVAVDDRFATNIPSLFFLFSLALIISPLRLLYILGKREKNQKGMYLRISGSSS